MNDKERADLALRIEQARTAQGFSKEAAAKAAGVTATTWRRAEGGLRVHDHKLAAMLDVVGLSSTGEITDTNETHPNAMWSDTVFVMPPEIEVGYTDVVRFTKAIQDAAPPLTLRATRLMLDAAGLFADAGEYLLMQEGGDGHDEDSGRGAAPIKVPGLRPAEQLSKEDVGLAAHEDELDIEDEQGHDETP